MEPYHGVMSMPSWIWFARHPGSLHLKRGSQTAWASDEVHARLRAQGLEPLLVLARERWEKDLAGGPPGLPERARTAAELAGLRADGELGLPTVSEGRDHGHDSRAPRERRHRFGGGRHAASARCAPQPPLRVRAQPWAQGIVEVAIFAVGDEVLTGTRRLFSADDDGLVSAATWKGQLEFACESWLEPEIDGAEPPGLLPPGPAVGDAEAMARLLDDEH